MAKFAKTLVTGLAAGAALGYFLSTEKGRDLKEKGLDLAKDYKENPEVYYHKAKQTVGDYSNLASQTFQEYKGKFESGELTSDDVIASVKEQAKAVGEVVLGQAQDLKEKAAAGARQPNSSDAEDSQAIIIDYPQDEE